MLIVNQNTKVDKGPPLPRKVEIGPLFGENMKQLCLPDLLRDWAALMEFNIQRDYETRHANYDYIAIIYLFNSSFAFNVIEIV